MMRIHRFSGFLLSRGFSCSFVDPSMCLARNGTHIVVCWEKLSFKFIKPQVQGTSLSTWGVVRRKLRF